MKIEKIEHSFGLPQTGLLSINSLDRVLKNLSLANKTPTMVFQLVFLVPLVSERQVWVGLLHSIQAFESNSNISKKPEFEILLRLSGKRQIKEALKLFSLKEKANQEVVLVGWGKNKKALKEKAQNLGQSLGFAPKTNLFSKNFSKNKKLILESYGISQNQISSFNGWKEKDAIEALVLEKMALLGLEG